MLQADVLRFLEYRVSVNPRRETAFSLKTIFLALFGWRVDAAWEDEEVGALDFDVPAVAFKSAILKYIKKQKKNMVSILHLTYLNY